MRGTTNAQPGGYIHKTITPNSNLSSGTIDGYKMGPLVVIRLFHCIPINAGDQDIATLPWTPVERFVTGNLWENNVRQTRSLYTTNDRLGIRVVAGDSDFYGELVYITNA